MLSTVLVLGYGKPPDIEVRVHDDGRIGAVTVEGLRIQSHNPQCLLDLASALTDAAELLVREPVTT